MATDAADGLREGGVDYFRETRSLALGVLSILPLVALYHWGIVQSGHSERNLAEVWLVGPLELVGLEAAHVLNVALVVAFLAVLWRSERSRAFSLVLILGVVFEAAVYAALLYRAGPELAGLLNERADEVFFAVGFDGAAAAPLMLALGAGVYEELAFRLLLLGGGAWALHAVFRFPGPLSVVVALLGSSLAFAYVHHVGPLGEPLESYSFIFRAVCGMLLGLIFLARGLGVAVWTHALYNAFVMLRLLGWQG